MYLKHLLIIASMLLGLLACKKSDNSSPDPTPNLPTTKWYSFRQFSGDTAKAMGGYLYLTSKYVAGQNKGTSVTSSKKLHGDFELLVKYSSFHTTGTSSISETFGVTLEEDESKHTLLSGELSNSYMYAADSVVNNTLIKSTSNREGEWYVKRVGSNYTSWFRAGTDTLKLNKTNYSTNDLRISFLLFASDNTTTNTSVHVDDLSIIGGGTDLTSDPFDVDDITAY